MAIDLLFTCNTYHHIAGSPCAYFRACSTLAPNGTRGDRRVRRREGWFPRMFDHVTPPDQIAREMREAGYEQLASHGTLPRQSFQIFRADDGTGE
jgi:hypothetical protein